ncbi:hypothetical protein C8J56DRAFT_898744 [Mycena floridula]|nr:hypothetical protein C8J56DRAFT_898744 [Mycena floridula]
MASSNHFMHSLLLCATWKIWQHIGHSCRARDRARLGGRITGKSYQDFIHMYALSRAGYIPQLFNLPTPFPAGNALLYDPSLSASVIDFGLPTFPYPRSKTITQHSGHLPDLPTVESTDMAMIFQPAGAPLAGPNPISKKTKAWSGISDWHRSDKVCQYFIRLSGLMRDGQALSGLKEILEKEVFWLLPILGTRSSGDQNCLDELTTTLCGLLMATPAGSFYAPLQLLEPLSQPDSA